ncbi:hypothetical protein ACS0TY_032148 [Phlomoides rotata]
MEGNGIVPNGWPLGLGNTNSRIRVVGVAAPPEPAACRRRRSLSFSSFSSLNLDTESTATFFRDRSVSLGRLMGIEASMHIHCGIEVEGDINEGDDVGVGVPNSKTTHMILMWTDFVLHCYTM